MTVEPTTLNQKLFRLVHARLLRYRGESIFVECILWARPSNTAQLFEYRMEI